MKFIRYLVGAIAALSITSASFAQISNDTTPDPYARYSTRDLAVMAITSGGMTDSAYVDSARRNGVDATPFEAVPFTGLTAPSEYSAYIAMIDGLTLPGGAIKTQIGAATDNTPIYSYTAGSGTKTIALISGQHSVEPVGQLANIRFFHWFETSNDMRARQLRASFKAVLVPNANPAAFKAAGGGRVNLNGVNLNRNYDFFWGAYDPGANVTNAKGTTAFSEPESRAIKSVLDGNDVHVLIDSHNMGASEIPQDIVIGAPSPWVQGNRSVVQSALISAAAATGASMAPYGVDFDGEPLLTNWASYYLTVVKGNRSAVAAIIESNSNLAGGTERVLTDAGAVRYCNAIYSIIRSYMLNGYRPDKASGYTTFLNRVNTQDTVSVTGGGTLLDTATATPISFDSSYATNLAGNKVTFRDYVAPTLGYFEVNVTGYLESGGSAEQRVDLGLTVNGTDSPSYTGSVTVPATAGARIPYSLTGRVQISTIPDAKAFTRLGVSIRKAGTVTANNPKIIRTFVDIRFTPNQYSAPVPVVPLQP